MSMSDILKENEAMNEIMNEIGAMNENEMMNEFEAMNESEAMIRLTSITEDNWIDVASLTVTDEQKRFLAPPIGILARGYVYRDCNAKVFAIALNDMPGDAGVSGGAGISGDAGIYEGAGISGGVTISGDADISGGASKIIGVCLVREFTDEPLGYDLQQFMIDKEYQGKGYGTRALKLILEELKKEHHYDHVEVCVGKEDAPALRIYEKCGFVDSGFVDEDIPDSVNLICRF